jgi:hypothetical protein
VDAKRTLLVTCRSADGFLASWILGARHESSFPWTEQSAKNVTLIPQSRFFYIPFLLRRGKPHVDNSRTKSSNGLAPKKSQVPTNERSQRHFCSVSLSTGNCTRLAWCCPATNDLIAPAIKRCLCTLMSGSCIEAGRGSREVNTPGAQADRN